MPMPGRTRWCLPQPQPCASPNQSHLLPSLAPCLHPVTSDGGCSHRRSTGGARSPSRRCQRLAGHDGACPQPQPRAGPNQSHIVPSLAPCLHLVTSGFDLV
ncbi:hypothetical protein BDA96_01G287400 [Sorghum bicolor]|nr:hypothetical protein BDA96_01G287400 [Sorghum bicolor]